jgi:NAD(P)-dependent dehydrogenase (short-subunit alcohol dehydrogenase family)
MHISPTLNSKKVAIVTGASQGIGKATAIRLAQDFEALVVVARDSSKLDQTGEIIRSTGAEVLVIAVDLKLNDATTLIVQKTIDAFGRIDAVVNIAGDVPQIDLFEMSDKEWDDGLSLKFHGARKLTMSCWEHLKKTKGSVIFTSGTSAQVPKANFAAVSAINASIIALAKAFADRGISDNVQVNSVLPGAIFTERRMMFLKKWASKQNLPEKEAISKFLLDAGISRYGSPEEVADLMAYIVSPSAKWITGTTFRIDGGEVKAV